MTKLTKEGEAAVGAEYVLDGQSLVVHCPLVIASAVFAVDFTESRNSLLEKYWPEF